MTQDVTANKACRPELVTHGMRIGEHFMPLLAGSVHYYHLEVEHWKAALTELRTLGCSFVDTYVPWGIHEQDGAIDFGATDPRLDLARFLRTAAELGLYAIIRPGPHVNAELTRFGIPERIVWDEDCMARSASGSKVVLPVPPLAFPLPSYASQKFLKEVAHWYEQVGSAIGSLAYPNGPIVMVQVDNEATLSFRDGIFDQDYHPDAVAQYRRFLQQRYTNVDELRQLYNNPGLTFARMRPPEPQTLKHLSDLTPVLDWAEAQEAMLGDSLRLMAGWLRQQFPTALLSHNLPPGWDLSPLDPARLARCVDIVGGDYYHLANPAQHRAIHDRTTELRAHSAASNKPCFAAELGVGFPPYFAPHTETDSRFSALTTLAYGVQGFNLYMAVERSRWIGAPIGVDGTPRPEATFYQRLVSAVRRTELYTLERCSYVTIVIPRELRRLCRALHVLNPLSPTLLAGMTGDPLLGPGEQELGLPSSLAMDSLEFLQLFEQALEQRHIPYRVVSTEQLPQAIASSQWTLVLCCGLMQTPHWNSIRQALTEKRAVTLGPHFPSRDERLQAQGTRRSLPDEAGVVPPLLGLNPPAIAQAVSAAVAQLPLPALPLEGEEVHGSLFQTRSGSDRVAFLINPTTQERRARWCFSHSTSVIDALTGHSLAHSQQSLSLTIAPHCVRMLELAPDS